MHGPACFRSCHRPGKSDLQDGFHSLLGYPSAPSLSTLPYSRSAFPFPAGRVSSRLIEAAPIESSSARGSQPTPSLLARIRPRRHLCDLALCAMWPPVFRRGLCHPCDAATCKMWLPLIMCGRGHVCDVATCAHVWSRPRVRCGHVCNTTTCMMSPPLRYGHLCNTATCMIWLHVPRKVICARCCEAGHTYVCAHACTGAIARSRMWAMPGCMSVGFCPAASVCECAPRRAAKSRARVGPGLGRARPE